MRFVAAALLVSAMCIPSTMLRADEPILKVIQETPKWTGNAFIVENRNDYDLSITFRFDDGSATPTRVYINWDNEKRSDSKLSWVRANRVEVREKDLDIVVIFTKPVERTIVYNLKAESSRKLVGTLTGPDRTGTANFTAYITLSPRTD